MQQKASNHNDFGSFFIIKMIEITEKEALVSVFCFP